MVLVYWGCMVLVHSSPALLHPCTIQLSLRAPHHQHACTPCTPCRYELKAQGIKVVLIKPGGVKTPLWESGMRATEQLVERIPREGMAPYQPLWRQVRAWCLGRGGERGGCSCRGGVIPLCVLCCVAAAHAR